MPCVGVHSPISLTYPLADMHMARRRNAFFQKPYYVSNAEYPKITPAALPLFCAGMWQQCSKEVDTHFYAHARTHTHNSGKAIRTTHMHNEFDLFCLSRVFTVYLLTCTHCNTILSKQLLLEHPRESACVHN